MTQTPAQPGRLALPLLLLAGLLCFAGCQNEERHIVSSFGYYEKIVNGSMADVLKASTESMKAMSMTIDKEDRGPWTSVVEGKTDGDDKRVKLTLTWMNAEYIRIGLRIGDGMAEGGDPRAIELIKKIEHAINPRMVPRDSIKYPENFPDRLRY